MNLQKICSFFVISIIAFADKSSHQDVKLGFLSDSTEEMRFAFRYAVKKIKQNENIRHIEGDERIIEYGDVFSSYQVVCGMLENEVLGIIGPSSPEVSNHVRSVCDAKEIPMIETRIDGSEKHVINLHPTPEDLGRVFLDLIHAFNWKGFTILYEDAPWLRVADYLLRNYKDQYPTAVRQLDVTENNNYRPQLLHVKKTDEINIVLCCSIEKLEEIMKQAQQVGLLSDKHNVIITSLDIHTIDLEPYQYGGTNITGARLVIPTDDYVKEIAAFFTNQYMEDRLLTEDAIDDENAGLNEIPDAILAEIAAEKIRLETALTFDAVTLFAHVMDNNRDIQAFGIDCNNPDSTFINGVSIFNSMKTITFKGLSGEVQFDQHGNRENFKLEILELQSDGLEKIGTWDSDTGLDIDMNRFTPDPPSTNPFHNKVLKVLTNVPNEPYAMRKQTAEVLIGNDQFEGYGIELIEKLAAHVGFNYTIELQDDREYGSPLNDGTGNWNGMFGELMASRADLAISDLTVTSAREEVVDFTSQFMHLGIQIVFQKPKKADPELLSFMEPFSASVWGCLAAAILVVSVSFFIMGRMSPKEWDNPYPCIEEPTVLQNQFTIKNAMWFTIGAILQEGSDIAPKAPSTRIVASIWWFFTLIMVSSYTANLASFLTVQKSSPTISNVKDLIVEAEKGNLKYGAKRNGATYKFFEISDNEDYQKMYKYMKDNDNEVMKGSNDDGVEEARKGNYAFLMESSTIEYKTQRICEIFPVGDKLDNKGYGIAMTKGSPFRAALDEGILKMQESGELERMRTKWWREKRGGGACLSTEQGAAPKLTFDHVKGIFLVLFCGCCVGTVLGIIRWLINIRKISKVTEIPFKEIFKEESRFVFQFSKTTKPAYLKNGSSYDAANISRRVSHDLSMSRSRSSISISEDHHHHHPHTLRLSSKNIHKIGREDA